MISVPFLIFFSKGWKMWWVKIFSHHISLSFFLLKISQWLDAHFYVFRTNFWKYGNILKSNPSKVINFERQKKKKKYKNPNLPTGLITHSPLPIIAYFFLCVPWAYPPLTPIGFGSNGKSKFLLIARYSLRISKINPILVLIVVRLFSLRIFGGVFQCHQLNLHLTMKVLLIH